MLTGAFNGKVAVSPDEIKKAIRSAQNKIFATRPKTMGPIHALMLQLVANGIVKLGIADSNKVGKDKLTVRDVELKLATVTHETILTPAHMVPSMYNNMNTV